MFYDLEIRKIIYWYGILNQCTRKKKVTTRDVGMSHNTVATVAKYGTMAYIRENKVEI